MVSELNLEQEEDELLLTALRDVITLLEAKFLETLSGGQKGAFQAILNARKELLKTEAALALRRQRIQLRL